MFQFCTLSASDFPSISEDGFITTDKLRIHDSLSAALKDEKGSDRYALLVESEENISGVPIVSEMDFKNINPLTRLSEIAAAGGYVLRRKDAESDLEVLLIYRRGNWDLPKGKVDPGETIEEAGVREVEEEVSAENISVLARLEDSYHTYNHKGKLVFKTTTWYAMTTSTKNFVPQRSEDIQQVEWVEWDRAIKKLGYDSLRDHMKTIDRPALEKALMEPAGSEE